MDSSQYEKLEIVIPTWNRAEYLERTLIQFQNSPFFNYKITIIDNNSSDNTPEICEKYKQIFPNLHIIRNNKNIGLSGNILYSFTIAKAEYMWLVGDNDNYDFSDCSEVFYEIDKGEADIIFIQGVDGENKINLESTTVHELFEKGYGYDFFGLIRAISTYIFKTELYTSECIQQGYDIAKYLYPQLAFAKKALDENFNIYLTKKMIRIAEPNPHVSYNTLELINGWVNSMLIIDKKYRTEGLKIYLGHNLMYTIIGGIIAAKANKVEDYRKTLNNLIIAIFSAKGMFIGFIYAVIMLCVSIIPYKLAKYIHKKFT
jgi:glycosyltransferase involved in cell wall biosynthesis